MGRTHRWWATRRGNRNFRRAREKSKRSRRKGHRSHLEPLEPRHLLAGDILVVNTELDQQTLPACSLLGVPYAHSFDSDPRLELNSGDQVRLELRDGIVTLELLERTPVTS